jgi:Tfp pilus assembly protein PilX
MQMAVVLRMRNERGIALATVLMITMVVLTLMVSAAIVSSNTSLLSNYRSRETVLAAAADAGIEEARSALNGTKTLMPDTGYKAIETNAAVYNAAGTVIPNVTRTTYVGPTGITSGQYGIFGSVVVVVKDAFGNMAVRRSEVVQESFAKYAYFTDNEGGNICFANGDQLYGPVHSNDQIQICSSGAGFHSQVTTAQTITGKQYGTFYQGYVENGANIPFPTTADLNKLLVQATTGLTNITDHIANSPALGQANTRIEFLSISIAGDTEGFIRVYQSTRPGWVVADVPSTYTANSAPWGLQQSQNCGDYEAGVFISDSNHTSATWLAAANSATKRCLLGGADSLTGGVFTATTTRGGWVAWPGAVSPAVLLARPADAAYLWPVNRVFNTNYKGVIYVAGNVAVSGMVRGHHTIAATGNIVIADDINYSVDPSLGTCHDMLGLFAGNYVVMADNTLNSAWQPKGPNGGGVSNGYNTYDDTQAEFVQAVVLALTSFTAENYGDASNLGESTNAQPCQTSSTARGCLYLTGGLIQQTRAPVGLTDGHGYVKRYQYDACGMTSPPPYFPTTGHYSKGHYFEVDPTNFNVANYFNMLTGG